MVNRWIAALVALTMLFCTTWASAEDAGTMALTKPASATVMSEGDAYTLSVAAIDHDADGNLTLTVTGVGDSIPFRDGQPVARFVAYLRSGGKECWPDDIAYDGGNLVFTFDLKARPDAVLLYAFDAEDVVQELAIVDEYGYTNDDVDALYDSLFDALEADLYEGILTQDQCAAVRATYAALAGGEVLKKGSKGNAVEGLQSLANYLGCVLTVDGKLGKTSLTRIATVHTTFFVEEPEITAVDISTFRELVDAAVVLHDPEYGPALLPTWYSDVKRGQMTTIANLLRDVNGW